MLDSDDSKYPTTVKEMSFDAKLFFVYFGVTFVLFVTAGLFSTPVQITILAALSGVLVILSITHRVKNRWHWPGIDIKNILTAIAWPALLLFFLGSFTPLVSPLHPLFFPWFAGGAGIILSSILSSLNIVFWSEKQFLTYCGDQDIPASQPVNQSHEPMWQKSLRVIFSIYFIIVWIIGVSSIWQFNLALRDGSLEPTANQTEALVTRGHTVYITPEEKRVISLLEQGREIGIPSALLLGAILHFVVGVKLFPNIPSLPEIIKKANIHR